MNGRQPETPAAAVLPDAPPWQQRASAFLAARHDPASGGYASVAGGPATLYGTCYATAGLGFLGRRPAAPEAALEFMLKGQDPQEGWFVGPELRQWSPPPGARHDREHLLWHLSCAAVGALLELGARPRHPLRFARRFADVDWLLGWLDRRRLADAWFEGSNLLFAGQLLVYLRDLDGDPAAPAALEAWFRWLEARVDPRTGLWGSDCGARRLDVMCGAYHQLLVYRHEGREVRHPERIVDFVLGLQHPDGGFAREGGGGACEETDALDLLVGCYKQRDYRRADIRSAVRRCVRLMLSLQNPDGGFPYRRGVAMSHMGIPDTQCPAGASGTFPTWFRIHALSLAAEVVPDMAELGAGTLGFSRHFGVGWHRGWDRAAHAPDEAARQAERRAERRWARRLPWRRAEYAARALVRGLRARRR